MTEHGRRRPRPGGTTGGWASQWWGANTKYRFRYCSWSRVLKSEKSADRLLLKLNLLEKRQFKSRLGYPWAVRVDGCFLLGSRDSLTELRNGGTSSRNHGLVVFTSIFGGFLVDHIFKNGLLLNYSLSSKYPRNAVVVGGQVVGVLFLKF